MEATNHILFIEAPIGDDILEEITRNIADYPWPLNLKIYKSSTKILHKTRKRMMFDDGLTPASYMVWNKQSLQDGKMAVRTCYDTYSTRLPFETAVEANQLSQSGFNPQCPMIHVGVGLGVDELVGTTVVMAVVVVVTPLFLHMYESPGTKMQLPMQSLVSAQQDPSGPFLSFLL
ncbi:MAG: hypothetical protein BYD32DRAFT_432287 [Podila humilis]|nr:MAG: hypothetical protein BYD32DRAFT_432287 [Podila humilis]